MHRRAIGIFTWLLATGVAGVACAAGPLTAGSADEPPSAAPSSTPQPGKEGFAPRRPWLGEACKQDFTTNCPGLPANSKRDDIVQCLKSHEEVLSEECRSALADRPPGYGRFAEHGGGPEMGGMGRHGGRGGRAMGGVGDPSAGITNPGSTIPPGPDSEETRQMLGDR